MKKTGLTRRSFVKKSAIAGLGIASAGCLGNKKPFVNKGHIYLSADTIYGQKVEANKQMLRVFKVGVGGMGAADTGSLRATKKVIITGMCDVDAKRLADHSKSFAGVPQFTDFRKMFKQISECDAVCVSTPDHTHAIIALEAMRQGKHVYVQKPLAHSFEECEMLMASAHKYGVVTQMGNQGHPGVWRYKQLLKHNFWGDIKEIYTWTSRPWWPHGMTEKATPTKMPEGFNWDCWIGPAQMREFSNLYAHFKWRGWVDFGCGAIGDMAVHNFDPAYFVLQLGLPQTVIAHGDKAHPWGGFPKKSTIDFHFGPTPICPNGIDVHWSEAGQRPNNPDGAHPSYKLGGEGCMIVGSKATTFGGSHASKPQCIALPGVQFGKETKEAQRKCNDIMAKPEVDNGIDWNYSHYAEWVNACIAGNPEKPGSKFDYSAKMTQALLLGCIAQFMPETKLTWDDKNKCFDNKAANDLLKGSQRDGFKLRI